MKTGIIDIGGGLRDIYGAGVLDRMLDENITVDYCLGISAGSANLMMFTSRQRGLSYRYYTEFAFRSRYMSPRNYLTVGSLMNLDYIYGEIPSSHGEAPMDYDTFISCPTEYHIGVLNANDGQPVYFSKHDIPRDDYTILMASSALPRYSKPYQIGAMTCYDGGLADPIPLNKALADGCERIILILTKPKDDIRHYDDQEKEARYLRKRGYYKAAISTRLKAFKYHQEMEQARLLEKQGKLLIVAPDDLCGVGVVTRDKEKLHALYQKGYEDGIKAIEFIKKS